MDAFVYGTLKNPTRVDSLLETYAFLGPAVLCGLSRVQGRYPTLAPGGQTRGRLLRTSAVDRLDAYEGVDRGTYVRVTVPCDRDVSDAVDVYVGDPARLGVEDEVTWPGDGPFRERVERYVATNDVRVVGGAPEPAADSE